MKNEKTVKVGFGSKLLYYFLTVVLWIAAKLLLGFKLSTDEKVKEWKRSGKSFVILSAHPSEVDALVMLFACFPRYARFVVAAQQLYQGTKGKLLRALHVVPKKQFTPDIKSIIEMIRTVKSGFILGMMPEGRVSMDSTENPIDDSTAKLIKKLGVPVAVLKPYGTYFVKPPFKSKGIIRGKAGGELKALYDTEDLAKMPDDEVIKGLKEALSYNISEELRGSGHRYGSRNKPYMKNVSNLFYRCPACGSMYTVTDDGRKLSCSSCNMEMDLTREMFFKCSDGLLPDNIASWNKMQLEFEHEYWQDPGASFSIKVRKAVMEIGKDTEFLFPDNEGGTLSLDASGLHYEDADERIDIALPLLPGVSGDYENSFITLYREDIIRRFYTDNVKTVARFINSLMVLKDWK